MLLVGLVVVEIYRGPRSFLAGFDRGVQASLDEISKGDSKQFVVEVLGEPRQKSDKFLLPQRYGFEPLFDEAEGSSAIEYYQWINGSNWYYCIGFDASGNFVIIAEGHS